MKKYRVQKRHVTEDPAWRGGEGFPKEVTPKLRPNVTDLLQLLKLGR